MANKKKAASRSVAFPGDLHCGHVVGLTPPDWRLSCGTRASKEVKKIRRTQEEAWDKYKETCDKLKPDVAVWMGDLIDGRGERSGGTELITTDRREQAEIAAWCIVRMGAPRNILIRGTPYHSGASEQFEDLIPAMVFEICENEERPFMAVDGPHDHEQLDIGGVIFDVKHKVGASTIPHGSWTPIAREDLWQALYAEAGLMVRADWVVRAHTHTHIWGGRMAGDKAKEFVSTPALQCMGSRYGRQQSSKLVDWGVFAVRIEAGQVTPIRKYIQTIGAQASKPQVI